MLGSVRVFVKSGAAVEQAGVPDFSLPSREENQLFMIRVKAHFIETQLHILFFPSIMTDGAQISLAHPLVHIGQR